MPQLLLWPKQLSLVGSKRFRSVRKVNASMLTLHSRIAQNTIKLFADCNALFADCNAQCWRIAARIDPPLRSPDRGCGHPTVFS